MSELEYQTPSQGVQSRSNARAFWSRVHKLENLQKVWYLWVSQSKSIQTSCQWKNWNLTKMKNSGNLKSLFKSIWKHIVQPPLNTEYKILTVYFIIHASISPQIRIYNPKFVIKFLNLIFFIHQQSYYF